MSDQTLTVSELGAAVRAVLENAMPYGVWVEGEIQGITRSRNGHVYFDLIEPAEGPGAPPIATMPVVLFRESRDRVNKLLTRHGDPIRMTDGVRIRIQGMVDYYPPSGRIQLRMSAIDPTYTLGVLAAEREALLRQLSESGQLRANAGRTVPDVPLRIGLVTSLGSAAHADVITVFEASGFSFDLIEVDTAVQGAGAERSIAAAIHTVGESRVDVALVIRGGGSKTDLAVFDHHDVAMAIVNSGVAVFTGVGHDIDRSVADEVAHTAHTTPTAAAQTVVTLVETWLGQLDDHGARIVQLTRQGLIQADARLDRLRQEVLHAAARSTSTADARLAAASSRLTRAAARAETAALGVLERASTRLELAALHVLQAEDLRLDTSAARAKALDPAVNLSRGWSITRDSNGQVVRSIEGLNPGERLSTQVADGTIASTIADND